MRQRLAFMIMCVAFLLASSQQRQHKLSAFSRLYVQSAETIASVPTASMPPRLLSVFVTLRPNSSREALQQCGVKINSQFGNVLTAQVPANQLYQLLQSHLVDNIALAQPIELCNDSARYYSRVDAVHQGLNLPRGYTGRGVIVGIIDTGIDFNHINLCDSLGQSRVKAAYLPCDYQGQRPIIDGDTLPGSAYEGLTSIARLTTDSQDSFHGTHTLGTAAGSYRENAFYGVAPDAVIVACAMPEDSLTDVNVANSVRYIFDYANRVGMPCVVNMSLGSCYGPHDGTSYLCQVFQSLSGPGRVCVLAAGNDGNAPVSLRDTIVGYADTVTTLLRNQYGALDRRGYVDMWSDHAQEHRLRVVVVNRGTGALEYASPMIGLLPSDSVYTINALDDTLLMRYYIGEVQIATAIEDNGRYRSVCWVDVTSQMSGHLIGLQYVSDTTTILSGHTGKYTYFYDFGLEGVTGGTSSGSISDIATSDHTISVGAYSSRASVTMLDGSNTSFTAVQPTDIADFSSYGPDDRGVMRPDVCAPGNIVVSSSNRYDTTANYLVDVAHAHGVEYPYRYAQGTSMSAPVVAGAIALWLQANPRLDVAMIRDVLKHSCSSDAYVAQGDASRWGYGKLDVAAGLDYVLNNARDIGDVNGDGVISVADVNAIIDIMLGNVHDAFTCSRADVNDDDVVGIADVSCTIEIILKPNATLMQHGNKGHVVMSD